MLSFNEFNSHEKGTYVSYKLDTPSQEALHSFVKGENIGGAVDPLSYHCTIVYSRTPCPSCTHYQFPNPVTCHISEWKLFPTQKGTKCLVAVLDAPEFTQAHKDIRQVYGASHDYPDYHAHVTVSYDYTDETMPVVPNMLLTFDEPKVAGLDPDFTPKKDSG